MLPLSLFANRVFARTTLIGLLLNIPFYGLIFVFSLYFQKINGLSPLATGLAFVPMMGMVLPVNLLAPRLAERFGGPLTVAAGALISAAACLALLGTERGTSYWTQCAQLMAIGGGLAAKSRSPSRASATANVHTLSSVKRQAGWNNRNSHGGPARPSNREPIMSPAIAPSMLSSVSQFVAPSQRREAKGVSLETCSLRVVNCNINGVDRYLAAFFVLPRVCPEHWKLLRHSGLRIGLLFRIEYNPSFI